MTQHELWHSIKADVGHTGHITYNPKSKHINLNRHFYSRKMCLKISVVSVDTDTSHPVSKPQDSWHVCVLPNPKTRVIIKPRYTFIVHGKIKGCQCLLGSALLSYGFTSVYAGNVEIAPLSFSPNIRLASLFIKELTHYCVATNWLTICKKSQYKFLDFQQV